MATDDSTASEVRHDTEESRKGAMACLNALRIIERMAVYNPDSTMTDWWREIDAAQVAMVHAAGTPDRFMAGFVSVFAEYAHFISNTGTPDLYIWKPEATMTDEEKAKCRIEFDEQVAEGNASCEAATA